MNDSRRVIIIGSGPTGAMTALQLSRKGIPVTMLEAGSDFTKGLLLRIMGKTVLRRQPDMMNGDSHVASGDPSTAWYYFHSPGGLSNQWAGAVPRFAPEDFCEGARLHEKYRWPISYDDLAPYYDIVERLLKVTADARDVPNLPASHPTYHTCLPKDWEPIAGRLQSCGHGLTVMPVVDGGPWMLVQRGTAFNSFTEIIQKLARSQDFQFLIGAQALEMVWSGDQKKVTEVIYCHPITGSQHRIEAAAVVVAAGPLASTKLLLNSACDDFPEGLGNSYGVLGRYLHDHLKEWWMVDFDRPLSRLKNSVCLTRAPYADSSPLMAAQYTLGHAFPRDKIVSFVPSKAKTFGVNVFGTMRPVESNYVRMHPDAKDKHGLPLLDICMRYDDDAIQNMSTARDRFLELFEQAGYPGSIREVVPQLMPGASVHYGGTVRMHASPEYGMLDAWSRLHEVSNVVVADASGFTTAVEKNPTLTGMAIAARAADRLADDLKRE